MDQMADEITLTTGVKDKEACTAEERSTWVRGERIQNGAKVSSWRPNVLADIEPGETSRETDAQQPRECDSSHSPLFSLKMYLRRSFSVGSSSSESPTQQSNIGVDCAGIVLSCLFCRFYDMMLMLPASCERVANHCCPNYKQVIPTSETPSSSNEDSCVDCGLLSPCHDAGTLVEE